MEIVLLGTGAALPTKSRCTSATALIRLGEILLFDCGEGTQVQFQKAQLKPGKLSRIFISHFHGDHFYGLIGLLTSLQLGGRIKPLFLYGPKGLSEYLSFMQKMSLFTLCSPLPFFSFSPSLSSPLFSFPSSSLPSFPFPPLLFPFFFLLSSPSLPSPFLSLSPSFPLPWP